MGDVTLFLFENGSLAEKECFFGLCLCLEKNLENTFKDELQLNVNPTDIETI